MKLLPITLVIILLLNVQAQTSDKNKCSVIIKTKVHIANLINSNNDYIYENIIPVVLKGFKLSKKEKKQFYINKLDMKIVKSITDTYMSYGAIDQLASNEKPDCSINNNYKSEIIEVDINYENHLQMIVYIMLSTGEWATDADIAQALQKHIDTFEQKISEL